MRHLRMVRRPDRDLLRKVRLLMAEIRSIEEREGDLLYEAHYLDTAAMD